MVSHNSDIMDFSLAARGFECAMLQINSRYCKFLNPIPSVKIDHMEHIKTATQYCVLKTPNMPLA